MILASILILADEHLPMQLPPPIEENIASFKRMHPGMEHRLFAGSDIRQLLSDRFGREVVSAYDTLKPFAYKSDLARYCIMHEFGGVYADLSIRFLGSLLPTAAGRARPDTKLCVFRDFLSGAPWDTFTAVFAAPPCHKALAKAVDLVCADVANGYRGPTFLCPTGPTLFGQAIALTCAPEELITGDSAWLDFPRADLGRFADGQRHAMLFGRTLICFKDRKPTDGFDAFGFPGTNSYADLWKAGDIYHDREIP